MKIKFAGFLRGLLRHAEDRETTRPVAVPAAPTPVAPAPASLPAAPAAAMSDAFAPASQPAQANANEIALPLAAVIAHLPMDLKAKLMSAPAIGQIIALPVDKVINQLAFGSVKVSFGELRRLAPGIFANSGGEFDSRQVSLPLAEILSRLNPALLARKPVQKVDVAEDIAGPFDGRGRGITFTTQPLKPSTASPTMAELNQRNQPVPFNPPHITPAPTPAPAPVMPPRAVTPAPSADTEVFSFKPRQAAPPSAPIPFNPPISMPTPPSHSNGNGNGYSNGHTNGNGNGNGNSNGNGNGNGNNYAALPPFKFATAPAPSAPVNSSLPRPEPAQPKLMVALDDLAENWPDALKQEILRSNLANSDVPLPMSLVEAGLKRGRVTTTWRELRTLIKPSSPASPHDELQLDLPLKVLAPTFLSAQKQTGKTQKRLAVAEEIPNLFFGFPQAAAAEAAEPAAVPGQAPAPAARTADTNFYTASDTEDVPPARTPAPATDFVNRHTHPQEVVARALALSGVAGAVVTLADGLRVASQVPADMNADAVAAFLPQIFERVNQTTRELRMGALNNVGFTVGNVPWKIFRINSIYFAAFGRAGEALPKSQLAGLAAELDRKKQF
ncbi:MAG: hypothetical protein P4N60_04095 [Verrucomicrobiae bacterium]|nr:hypothetical protein [Verrucomicrobiae bacterium]